MFCILGTGLAAAHPWKEQRTFTLNLLRGFGFSKTSMESTIADEAKRFASVVAKERGSPVCINGLINKAVANVIYVLLFSVRDSNMTTRSFIILYSPLRRR